MTHTPAPWKLSEKRVDIPTPLTQVIFFDNKADAALVAAAPELLAALKYALPFIPEGSITAEAYANGGRKVADVVRAAIAKAGGAA